MRTLTVLLFVFARRFTAHTGLSSANCLQKRVDAVEKKCDDENEEG